MRDRLIPAADAAALESSPLMCTHLFDIGRLTPHKIATLDEWLACAVRIRLDPHGDTVSASIDQIDKLRAHPGCQASCESLLDFVWAVWLSSSSQQDNRDILQESVKLRRMMQEEDMTLAQKYREWVDKSLADERAGLLEEGLQKGKQQGHQEASKSMLRSVLNARFGSSGEALWQTFIAPLDIAPWEQLAAQIASATDAPAAQEALSKLL